MSLGGYMNNKPDMVFRSPKIIFTILTAVILAAGLFYAAYSYPTIAAKDGVWLQHIRDGKDLLNGIIPEVPTYPMWGYSLLAAILTKKIILLQAILAFIAAIYWYRLAIDYTKSYGIGGKLSRFATKPVIVAVFMLPWLFMSVRYYTTSLGASLMLLGTCLMTDTVLNQKGWRHAAASAVFFGLASNLRSEYIAVTFLVFLSAVLYLKWKNIKKWIPQLGVFAVVFLLCLAPWLIYTQKAVGTPMILTTNGPAVMYIELGRLPNNPWKIICDDSYAIRLSQTRWGVSPWSYQAAPHFRKMFVNAVKEHPYAYVKRVIYGLKLFFMQGVHFPDLRTPLAGSERDEVLLDLVNESFKAKLGIAVNQEQINSYRQMGIQMTDVSFRHYAIVIAEYCARLAYLTLFLLLLFSGAMFIFFGKTNRLIAWLAFFDIAFVLFHAAFIQSWPRNTTVLIPLLLWAIAFHKANAEREEALTRI